MDLAKEKHISKSLLAKLYRSFWTNNLDKTPSVHGDGANNSLWCISKQAGERWCEWYHNKFGVDVRSLRYPGANWLEISTWRRNNRLCCLYFPSALKNQDLRVFLVKNTALPMMHMEDARATIEIMHVPSENIKIR